MSGHWRTFDTYGYMVFKIPEETLEVLADVYKEIKNKTIFLPLQNYKLAGQIKEEYSLEHLIENPLIQTYLTEKANTYMKFFNVPQHPLEVECENVLWGIKLKHLWINIQKKHEYNPIHNHGGVLSFVIWLKIPYDIKKETLIASSTNKYSNGGFFFHPLNSVGDVCNIPPKDDEYQEGNLVVFHARLNHSVNPFYTSDEDRVSISGNFYYELKETK